jgi:hypothetical protein
VVLHACCSAHSSLCSLSCKPPVHYSNLRSPTLRCAAVGRLEDEQRAREAVEGELAALQGEVQHLQVQLARAQRLLEDHGISSRGTHAGGNAEEQQQRQGGFDGFGSEVGGSDGFEDSFMAMPQGGPGLAGAAALQQPRHAHDAQRERQDRAMLDALEGTGPGAAYSAANGATYAAGSASALVGHLHGEGGGFAADGNSSFFDAAAAAGDASLVADVDPFGIGPALPARNTSQEQVQPPQHEQEQAAAPRAAERSEPKPAPALLAEEEDEDGFSGSAADFFGGVDASAVAHPSAGANASAFAAAATPQPGAAAAAAAAAVSVSYNPFSPSPLPQQRAAGGHAASAAASAPAAPASTLGMGRLSLFGSGSDCGSGAGNVSVDLLSSSLPHGPQPTAPPTAGAAAGTAAGAGASVSVFSDFDEPAAALRGPRLSGIAGGQNARRRSSIRGPAAAADLRASLAAPQAQQHAAPAAVNVASVVSTAAAAAATSGAVPTPAAAAGAPVAPAPLSAATAHLKQRAASTLAALSRPSIYVPRAAAAGAATGGVSAGGLSGPAAAASASVGFGAAAGGGPVRVFAGAVALPGVASNAPRTAATSDSVRSRSGSSGAGDVPAAAAVSTLPAPAGMLVFEDKENAPSQAAPICGAVGAAGRASLGPGRRRSLGVGPALKGLKAREATA